MHLQVFGMLNFLGKRVLSSQVSITEISLVVSTWQHLHSLDPGKSEIHKWMLKLWFQLRGRIKLLVLNFPFINKNYWAWTIFFTSNEWLLFWDYYMLTEYIEEQFNTHQCNVFLTRRLHYILQTRRQHQYFCMIDHPCFCQWTVRLYSQTSPLTRTLKMEENLNYVNWWKKWRRACAPANGRQIMQQPSSDEIWCSSGHLATGQRGNNSITST
jgi:hypothetical protein